MFQTKIYVKLSKGAQPLIIREKGDWIDLCSNAEFDIKAPTIKDGTLQVSTYKIPLGVAMMMPKGYEAHVASRSSTFKTYGMILWNAVGIIDNSYNGTNDEWLYGGIGLRDGHVAQGDRICQFRIQLSQKATVWQKLKWFLSRGKIKFVYVDELSSTNRQGFGKGTGAR